MALTQAQLDGLIQNDGASTSINTVLSQLNLAGGGSSQVSGLVYNDITAANANSAAIQAALNAAGQVRIDGPGGSVVYLGATLIINSNTHLSISSSITLRAASSIGNILRTSPTWNADTILQLNSGLQTTGPQSVIWEGAVTQWVTSTAYATGAYVFNGTGMYWCAAGGTSGATAPTGTGAGISDGVCTWNYITTYTIPINNALVFNSNILAVLNWPSHGRSVGDVVLLAPQGDAAGTFNAWTGTQAANTRGGPCDSAYFGAFRVLVVNDSNNITLSLHRTPGAQHTGIPMRVNVGVSNIIIDGGGTIDYNYTVANPVNNPGLNDPTNIAVLLYGGMQVTVRDLKIIKTAKYNLCLSGVADVLLDGIHAGEGTNSDRIKVYGASNNVAISNSSGINGDDIISLHPMEPSAWYKYVMSIGDVINVKITGVSSESGNGCIELYAYHPLLLIDGVDISHISIHGEAPTMVQIQNNGVSSSAAPVIGTVYIHDTVVNVNTLVRTLGTTYGIVNTLTIENITYNPGLAANATACVLSIEGTNTTLGTVNISGVTGNVSRIVNMSASTAAVSTFNISGCNLNCTTLAGSAFFNGTGGTVGTLNFIGNTVTLGNYANGMYLYNSAMVFGTININENTFIFADNITSSVVTITTSVGTATVGALNFVGNTTVGAAKSPKYIVTDKYGTNISFIRNNFTTATNGLVDTFANSRIFLQGNLLSGLTQGVVRYDAASLTCAITSGGGNIFPSTFHTNGGGTGTTSVYGWDISVSLLTTLTPPIGRTDGSYCYNTNAALGTLGVAGLVSCSGTAANSWRLLVNPTASQY